MVMPSENFSTRNRYAPIKATLDSQELPPWVREEFVEKTKEFAWARLESYEREGFNRQVYRLIRPYVYKVLDSQPPANPQGGPWAFYIPSVLQKCEWWQFYDIVESLYEIILERVPKGIEYREANIENPRPTWDIVEEPTGSYEELVNEIFAREGLAWRLDGGQIQRATNPQVKENIEAAHAVLMEPRFLGPDDQFQAAIDHLNRRPNPELRSCVTECIGSVEGVANIIAGTQGKQLSRLLATEPLKSNVHGALRKALDSIYGYRGNTAAHGQGGESEIGIEEADFVLGICASTLVYLAKKFPAD